MNLMAQKQISIVNPAPGTTRDLLSTNVTLSGYQVVLTDTAGLRQTTNEIEQEGIKLAKEKIKHSHAIIVILDVT